MSEDFSKLMTPLDQTVSNQSLQLTKLLIPFLPPKSQRMLAIYVKFIEFQNTLSHFKSFCQKSNTPEDILDTLKPHLSNDASEQIENAINLMQMFTLFQTMQQTSEHSDNFDPMSMMTNMLTPEQQNMFSTYQTMFTQELTNSSEAFSTTKKEGDNYDGLA